MKIGTIVEYNGRRGVVVNDFMSCCTTDETPVVFYGDDGFNGTPTAELKIIGPENPIPDLAKCGAGQEAKCCIFLTMGPKGTCCERHSDLRYSLIFKQDMSAKRQPVKPFPECQDLTDGVPELSSAQAAE